MTVTPQIEEQKRKLIADLRKNGPIQGTFKDSALQKWERRSRIKFGKGEFATRVQALRRSGLITGDRYHVALLEAAPVAAAVQEAEKVIVAGTAIAVNVTKPPKANRLVVEAMKLPVSERLMLVGQIVDESAAQLDEHFEKLRSVLG